MEVCRIKIKHSVAMIEAGQRGNERTQNGLRTNERKAAFCIDQYQLPANFIHTDSVKMTAHHSCQDKKIKSFVNN